MSHQICFPSPIVIPDVNPEQFWVSCNNPVHELAEIKIQAEPGNEQELLSLAGARNS